MTVPTLEQTVQEAFEENGWPISRQCILAAVSGGPDSMALAHVLYSLGLLGAIAHVNYGLREEADQETMMVQGFAQRLKVPCFVLEAKMETGESRSIQMWAREVRYEFFEKMLHQNGLLACALGHHADDQVETILFRLLRSRSTKPLSGIPISRGLIIRPLLSLPKSEIRDYCIEKEIPYCEDESNFESKYLRNKIRNQLLPKLKELNPRVVERLLEASHDLQSQDAWVSKKLSDMALHCVTESGGCFHLQEGKLSDLDSDLELPMFMAWWLKELGAEGNEIRTVLEGLRATTGAKWMLKAGTLKKEVKGWSWEPHGIANFAWREGPSETLYSIVDFEPRSIDLGGWRIETRNCMPGDWTEPGGGGEAAAFMDAGKVVLPLLIRTWSPPDKIRLLGLNGSKRVKDLIQDGLKRGSLSSPHQLVVEDAHGTIIYVSGCRISESVIVRPETENVFKIQITPTE